MAKVIDIVNGSGESELINDTYSVSASVLGYDNSTIDPSSITVEEGTNSYALTIAAVGCLTLHVSEDGTSTGTPIVGATFKRCDSTGVEYGDVITTNTNGEATFNNVPFASENAPVIYFKQTASDGDHEFSSAIQNTTLTTSSDTLEITNAPGTVRTITLTDANYQNLPIANGTITLNN